MNLDAFHRERSEAWAELDRLMSQAGRRPGRLGPEGVRRFGAAYRAAAADLALARRRWPGDPVVGRLEDLVGRARHLVYASERRTVSLREFFATRYWRLVRERAGLVVLAWALILVPTVLVALWAASDPPAAEGLVPGVLQGAGEASGDLGLPVGAQAVLAGRILTNNIQVSFLAFAGGIAAGLGTVAVLLFNGAIVGAVAGIAFQGGSGGSFLELVAPHGVLELSVIVVSAAAGLGMGRAIIDPGRRSRRAALTGEARQAVEIVLGTVPWFVLAGLVEGFVTPTAVGLAPALVLGTTLGVLYWALVVWWGRPPVTVEPAPWPVGR
jgi:uncharacterized membrane protein SpoIIM required for sporulation